MFRFEQDDGLFVNNDHLNLDNQKESGMNDHGLMKSSCRIPCDHVPTRSWPLFKARDLMRGVIESLRQDCAT